MSSGRTLFERIRNPGNSASRTVNDDTEELADSVLRHLRKMLNTRQGHCLIRLDYGMPDFTQFTNLLPEAIGEIQFAIKNSIERYEPRLKNVSISHIPSSDDILHLHFEITAELVTTKEEASIWFETAIDSSGFIEIRG